MIGLLLTIDIGNTNLTIGAYSGEELKFVSRLATDRSRTEDQYAIELKSIFDLYGYGFDEFTGCAISSVVPELTGAISHAAKRITGSEPIVLGPGVKTGINILADDPSQAGADLVAASVAAANLYELPCFVIDLGTATKSMLSTRTALSAAAPSPPESGFRLKHCPPKHLSFPR